MKLAIVLAIVCAAIGTRDSCRVTTARAETKLDSLFKKGKQQLADKKYAEACATFEEVDKLEPGIGAKLNVARCYEEWEKLAAAYRWYADAQQMAVETKDKRTAKIKELIDALDADVPRLTIKLPAKIDPAAAAVQLDTKPFPAEELGKEQRVDPGQHVIDYMTGKTAKKKTVNLERGASSEVELSFDATAVVKKDGPKPGPAPPRNTRKLAGLLSGATGVVALGVASVLTLTARSNYNNALDEHCLGATDRCDDKGLSITSNAKSRANIATVVSVIGGVAIATGAVLYLTSPKTSGKTSPEKRALYLAPGVRDDGGTVTLGGRF